MREREREREREIERNRNRKSGPGMEEQGIMLIMALVAGTEHGIIF